jgi:large subunit ribosomal protein L9
MELVLLDDVDKLGAAGSVVNVANGYARNYLLPKGLALKATEENKKRAETERKIRALRAGKEKAKAEELAQLLGKTPCTIRKQAGENDRLFGSVTAMDIAKGLKGEGIELDKKDILLKDPLKALGIYTVPVKLHPEVTAEIKVWVVKD